jgi:hypothetical protein
MFKNIVLAVSLVSLVACAGMNFGYKDPASGVDVTCKDVEGTTTCSYIGPDGKEVFVSAPSVGEDVNAIPVPK